MCKHCWGDEPLHHKDYIRGGVDPEDFEKEVNYRPKKKKKNCKRSKTDEPCSFTETKILREYYSKYDERWHYSTVTVCDRCGKHGGWRWYSTRIRN